MIFITLIIIFLIMCCTGLFLALATRGNKKKENGIMKEKQEITSVKKTAIVLAVVFLIISISAFLGVFFWLIFSILFR